MALNGPIWESLLVSTPSPLPPVYWNLRLSVKTRINLWAAITCGQNLEPQGVTGPRESSVLSGSIADRKFLGQGQVNIPLNNSVEIFRVQFSEKLRRDGGRRAQEAAVTPIINSR